MNKIVRTTKRATDGITPEEKARLDEHTKVWISRAMRTEPIDPDKIGPAIKGIYAAAGLKEPRVVIAPSPLVMAFAYGAAAAIWHGRGATRSATYSATDSATRSATDSATRSATDSATDSATRSATDSATYSATDSATRSATYSATYSATRRATYSATDSATRSATYSATDSATYSATARATDSATRRATESAERHAECACRDIAGEFGIQCARNWHQVYQGGNMWAGFDAYLTAMRDVIGLRLPEHEAYACWEQAAIHGGFRVMHSEFCIVSDFPEFIRVDANNEPHCETGPSHRWRDGWELYHWHGVRVPGHWIMSPENVDPAEILSTREVEVRAAGISIVGMARMLDRLYHRIIDSDPDPLHGDLISVTIPGLPEPVRYLSAHCPRNGRIMEAVPNNITSVIGAQAWRVGIPASEFQYPEKRT